MFFPDHTVANLFDKGLRQRNGELLSWNLWFAWRPVYCSHGEEVGVAWLETIWRIKNAHKTVYKRR